MNDTWRHAGTEPAIDDMLADPIVHAVMRRDGIGEGEVRAALARARRGAALIVTLPATQTGRCPR